MKQIDQINISLATIEDVEEILALQKLAYLSEAQIIDDYTIPPLRQTVSQASAEFDQQVVLKVALDEKIIGSVRCYQKEGTCYIGKLIVHPDFQNQGIGTKLLKAAEAQYLRASRYELFTGEKSKKNIYLYEKNGYLIFNTVSVSDKLTLVFMEKNNSAS